MNKMIQKITESMPKNPKYKQDELEAIRIRLENFLNAIVSKTLYSNINFRNEVKDYSESTVRFKKTKIKAKEDVASFSIVLRVWLIGYEEVWMINIYTNRYDAVELKKLCSQIKEAARSVCGEIDEKYGSLNNGDIKNPDINELDGDGDLSGVEFQTRKRRKRGPATAYIISDTKIVEILRIWDEKYPGVKKIDQPDFWKILSLVGIESNRIGVLNLFKNKGIIIVSVPVKRKPVVEKTQLATDILDEYKRQLEIKKLEAEEEIRLQKILVFSKQTLPSLEILGRLNSLCSDLKAKKAAEKEIRKKIVELQAALRREEQRLTDNQTSRERLVAEVEKVASQVNPEKLSDLISIASQK